MLQSDDLSALRDRLTERRAELIEKLAGLDHLDGGLVTCLSEVQAALMAIDGARADGTLDEVVEPTLYILG